MELEIILRDLNDRGLGDIGSGIMTAQGIWASRTTQLGKELLAFVEEL